MNHIKKIFLGLSIIFSIFFLIGSGLLISRLDTMLGDPEPIEIEEELPPPPPEVQVLIDELPESDGYVLRRNATAYQIELFERLIHGHHRFYEIGTDVDLKYYASVITQNFIADFFTLSNKRSRADVGGLQFFSEDLVDCFRNFAIDEFYLYLNQLFETYGRESLPTVDLTTILSVEFESRWIETEIDREVDETVVEGGYYYGDIDDLQEKEEIKVIVVDIEWTYANSSLVHLDEFQRSARLILLESEAGVRIHVIELIEELMENGYENQGSFIE